MMSFRAKRGIWAAAIFALAGCATAPQQQVTAIVGASLIDGSGAAAIPNTTVIVRGDQIDSVGATNVPRGATVIDAHGLTLAPGFIDMHNHSGSGLNDDPSATTQVSQGITTLLVGQDGGSELPIAPYLTKLERDSVAVNVATFVGQSTVREKVMGDTDRTATAAEIHAMTLLVDQAMRDGAFGLSSGLEYEEAKKSSTEEVIALAGATARYGGIYITHVRDEAQRTFEAFEEAIRIGAEARVPVQISHIKMGSKSVWNRATEAVRMIDAARAKGQDVTADEYPYDAWHSTIRVIVPSGRYDDPKDVAEAVGETGGGERILIVDCKAHPDYEFKTLQQIADGQHITTTDAYTQIVRDGGATVVAQSMKEDDMRVFYSQPWVMVGSDGGISVRHPRGAGTYPRILGHYVRELHWMTLEEAIRKMTSLPAARLRISDRGLVKPAMKADLVLFDAARVIDRSTFPNPEAIADGIEHVFVNGVEVWRNHAVTGARPGRPLRIPSVRDQSRSQ